MELYFSVIVPVYNRPQEMAELLESLSGQSLKNFELIVVEDGSKDSSETIVNQYTSLFPIQYFYKENSGPGDSRNFGMTKAKGKYFVFFDSDCVLPLNYFKKLYNSLSINPLDVYGGPDNAHESFTDVQKAINYAMTSVFTTGGIRGKKNTLDTYQPRSFNMGFTQEVYGKIGGFSDIHPGEDPDLSYRIIKAGFTSGLIEEAQVFHKRRIDFGKFYKQVYKFGVVRNVLMKWYPEYNKLVYFFPTLFLLGSSCLLLLSFIIGKVALLPLLGLSILFFTDSLFKTKSPKIAFIAVYASFVQLWGYGYGFLEGYVKLHVMKGEEREVFKAFFFKK